MAGAVAGAELQTPHPAAGAVAAVAAFSAPTNDWGGKKLGKPSQQSELYSYSADNWSQPLGKPLQQSELYSNHRGFHCSSFHFFPTLPTTGVDHNWGSHCS